MAEDCFYNVTKWACQGAGFAEAGNGGDLADVFGGEGGGAAREDRRGARHGGRGFGGGWGAATGAAFGRSWRGRAADGSGAVRGRVGRAGLWSDAGWRGDGGALSGSCPAWGPWAAIWPRAIWMSRMRATSSWIRARESDQPVRASAACDSRARKTSNGSVEGGDVDTRAC